MKLGTEKKTETKSSEWVDKYYDRIYPVVLRMVANEETAKDLTQESFLRAWEKKESFRGDSEVGTWLYRIAVNVTLTYLGRNKRISFCGIEESAIPEQSDGIQRRMEKRDEGSVVREMISELPPTYRMALIMHYYEDMKLEDIAAVSGISKGTAAWRLFRARKMIQTKLKSRGLNT